ncbi:MAG: hypothetical protein WD847_14625 [Pirellulales bacterium]
MKEIKPMKAPPDTVLDELHSIRRRLLQQHGGIAGLAAFLRQEEAKSGEQIVEPTCDAEPEKPIRRSRNRRVVDG